MTELADTYLYYLGLGMGGGVLLILIFYVVGLFYGLCGNTPHDLYTGDCCDRSTGANLIAAATYLTFLLGGPLLVLTTVHFILGTGLDQIVFRPVRSPYRGGQGVPVGQRLSCPPPPCWSPAYCLLYLLISLYRKVEKYPGPMVDHGCRDPAVGWSQGI